MNTFPFESYINVNGKKSKIEGKIMLQKTFLNVSFATRDRAHGIEKILLLEISSAVSFYGGELKLVAKCRQINKVSYDIKIFGG